MAKLYFPSFSIFYISQDVWNSDLLLKIIYRRTNTRFNLKKKKIYIENRYHLRCIYICADQLD